MVRQRFPRLRPLRLLHLLDGLLSQAQDPARRSGVQQRRQQQRLAMTQRLLDPLPSLLVPPDAGDRLLWRGLRWGGLGLLLALWLRR